MKFEYDREADAAYIRLKPSSMEWGEVKKTVELNNDIRVDFDARGKMIGIEVLRASKVLHRNALLKAKSPKYL